MLTKEYDGEWCYTVQEQAEAMSKMAGIEGCNVYHKFNDVILTAAPGGDADILVRHYQEQCRIKTEEYREKRRAYEATPEGQEELRLAKIEKGRIDKLKAEPMKAFKLKDKDGWEKGLANNKDGYGKACFMYAARWAWLMEQQLDKGVAIADMADKMSSEANIEGITGFMYGCAVATLSAVWEHGEELRRWHNKDTQIGDEGDKANESGGVLNPAILTVG